MKNDLILNYTSICEKYTNNAAIITENLKVLEAKYNEKHRFYHNLAHIKSLLSNAERIKEFFSYSDELPLAIWYHDIIYNPFSKTNEEDSAKFALTELQKIDFPSLKLKNVAHIINRTKNHFFRDENESIELQLMLDLDLQTLGSTPENYDENNKNIRKEYKAVPSVLFRKGRKEILNKFLDAEFIYRTEYFREKYEALARINLKTK